MLLPKNEHWGSRSASEGHGAGRREQCQGHRCEFPSLRGTHRELAEGMLPRQPGSKSLWKQRNRREARTAAQDCGELLLEQVGEREESLEKDADARKQVLTVKCHGPANQQLEGVFPVIQVGCVWVGTSVAPAVLGVVSGVAEHSSIVPMGCSSLLAMKPRNASSHDPGSDASKSPRVE